MKIRSQFSGNLAADAEVKKFDSGKSIAEFSIAVNSSKFKDGAYVDATYYHHAKLPGNEGVYQYLKKGKLVELSGHWEYDLVPMDNSEKEYKKYVFVVDELKLLGSKE